MDFSVMNGFDIFEIYRRFCDIRYRNGYTLGEEGSGETDESQRVKMSREALTELLKYVESSLHSRISIIDELYKLMSRLDLTVDFSEFSRFYNFVFFVCRENGQKNITVSRAIAAWKLVLSGRLRLLKQWCDFVEENQRHNISEDTWQQVLAFSRCVHENLEGYDPEGAWPVLIDDFVDHMLLGSNENGRLFCNCGDSESQSCIFEDCSHGLKTFPGLKRKILENIEMDEMESLSAVDQDSMELSPIMSYKRSRLSICRTIYLDDNLPGNDAGENMDIVRHNGPVGCSKSPCAVEGCLSQGFAGLLSTRSCVRFNRGRSVPHLRSPARERIS